MALPDINALTYAELVELEKQIAARKQEKLAIEKQTLLTEFQQRAAASGFTLGELLGQIAGKSKGAKAASAAKFANPADPSQTWTGRGRKPQWLVDQIAAGRSQDDFLI